MEANHEEEKKVSPEVKKELLVIEGLAKVMIETKVNISQKEENYQAFYNPVQAKNLKIYCLIQVFIQMFNRDITVLVLKVYGEMMKQKCIE